MANPFFWLFGGGEDSTDAAERILGRSAVPAGPALAAKAAPVVGRTVQNDSAEDFLRGLDFFKKGAGMAEPYKVSGWVQQAIKLVAGPISNVPLRFSVMQGKKPVTVEDPDLAAFWQAPVRGPAGPMSWPDVALAIVGWLNLKGEAFLIADDTWLVGRRAKKNPLIMVRPDQMAPILSEPSADNLNGELIGWRFTDTRGRAYPLVPEQVYQTKFWNPYDPIRGLAPMWAAALAAESDAAAAAFLKTLMQNNGDRGPIISLKNRSTTDQPLSKNQEDQIKAALKAKLAQVRRGGPPEPLFVPAEVQVANPNVQSADAQFVACRVENRKEVYMIFGVPQSFAEQKSHALSGAHQDDRYILIEQTCQPQGTLIAATLSQISRDFKGLSAEAGAKLTAFLDWDEHSVFLQVRTERIDAWDKLCNRGMPPAEAGQYLGMRLPKFLGDDRGTVTTTVQLLEDLLETFDNPPDPPPAPPALPPSPPADPAEPTESPEDDDETAAGVGKHVLAVLTSAPPPAGSPRAVLALLSPPPAPPVRPVLTVAALPEPSPAAVERAAQETARERLWQKHARLRGPVEKKFRGVVKDALSRAKAQTLAKLKKKAGEVPVVRDDDDRDDRPHPGTALDIMFDPVSFGLDLSGGLESVAREAMQRAGEEVRAELGNEDPWQMEAGEVHNALRARQNLIRNSSQEMFDRIRDNLSEGFAAGETTDELAARVRQVFGETYNGQGQAIAVTETGAAYGAGRESGAKSIGYTSKSWLSSRDKKVRKTHVEADGQTADGRGMFTVGGEQCAHPCGEGLSAKEAVNCRCVVLYHVQ